MSQERLHKTDASSVKAAPPIVRDVLASPGQPLDAQTRAFMEPRFGYDFSSVRVHTDSKATQSARSVGASAYTVGQNIVFGAGWDAPGSSAGRLLLAHELTHVVQQTQSAGRAVASAVGAETEADALAGRITAGQNASVQAFSSPSLQRKDEDSAIPLSLKGAFNPSRYTMTDLQAELFRIQQWLINHPKEPMADSLRTQQTEIVATMRRSGKRTGQDTGLDLGVVDLRQFTPGAHEQAENERLNDLLTQSRPSSPNDPPPLEKWGIQLPKPQRVTPAPVKTVTILPFTLGGVPLKFDAAPPSPVKTAATQSPALATATMPVVRAGTEQQALLRAVTDFLTLKAVSSNSWELTVDGVSRTVTEADANWLRAAVTKQFHIAVSRSLNSADQAESGYADQKKNNDEFWFTSRAVALFGRIKDPGPDLTARIALARKKGSEANAAADAGDMAQAAALLMECEVAAKQSYGMYRHYWEGIIGAGETTITVLETTRDLSFGLLGLLAAVGTGGAAVGLLGAAELGGSLTIINAVAVGAPLLAKYGEAGLKVAYGDKVNWGDLAQETVEAIAMFFLARFGGKATSGIASRLVMEAAAGSVLKNAGAAVVRGVVAGLLSGKINATISQALHSILSASRGKEVTWTQVGDELIERFLDPKSNLIDIVLGGVVGYGQYKAAPPPTSPAPPPKQTVSSLEFELRQNEPRSNVIDLAAERARRNANKGVSDNKAANDNEEVVPLPRQRTGTDDVDGAPKTQSPNAIAGKPNLVVAGGTAQNAPVAAANENGNGSSRVVIRSTDGRNRPAATREAPPAQMQKPLSPRAQKQATQAQERAAAETRLQAKLADEQDFLAKTLQREREGPPQKGEKLSRQERDRVNDEHYGEIKNDTTKTLEAIEKLRVELESLATTPYQKARAYSFSAASERTVYARARGLDEISFKSLKTPSVDHIVPVSEIVEMPGWNKLSVETQRQILSRTDNLVLMEQGLNSSKGAQRWADWDFGRKQYGEAAWNAMVQRENTLRAALQSAIAAAAR